MKKDLFKFLFIGSVGFANCCVINGLECVECSRNFGNCNWNDVKEIVGSIKKQIDSDNVADIRNNCQRLNDALASLRKDAIQQDDSGCCESGDEFCGYGYTSFYITAQQYLAPITKESTWNKLQSMLENNAEQH